MGEGLSALSTGPGEPVFYAYDWAAKVVSGPP